MCSSVCVSTDAIRPPNNSLRCPPGQAWHPCVVQRREEAAISTERTWHDTQDERKRVLPANIAAKAGCSERTVRRALKCGGPPPRRRPGVRPSNLDPFKLLIDRLLSEGVWNAEVIYAEIRARGYRGGRSILRGLTD